MYRCYTNTPMLHLFYMFTHNGLFRLAYLSLSNDISTCETVYESLWKQHITFHKLFP